MKVELLKPVGGAETLRPGSVLEVAASRAERWIAAGIAKTVEVKSHDETSASVVTAKHRK